MIEYVFLGILQGVTEWLPVSSSGHLVLAQQFLGIEASVSFDIMLHFATLLAVLVVFKREWQAVLESLLRLDFKSGEGKLGVLLAVATIFSGFLALFVVDYAESMFKNTFAVGIALIVTGFIVASTKFFKKKGKLDNKRAALIGLAQGMAIIPGISRSGATISASLASGLKREEAIRFSFLLSIPAIAGATIYSMKDAGVVFADPLPLAVGMISAFIAGYASLKWLVGVIKHGQFYLFSVYCWIIGILVLAASVL